MSQQKNPNKWCLEWCLNVNKTLTNISDLRKSVWFKKGLELNTCQHLNRYRVVKIWRCSPRTRSTQWADTLGRLSATHHSQSSHLPCGGCAQRDRGSCPALTKRIVSAGHVNFHGDAARSAGQREAGCSLCNLLSAGSFHTVQSTHYIYNIIFCYVAKYSFHWWQKTFYVLRQ